LPVTGGLHFGMPPPHTGAVGFLRGLGIGPGLGHSFWTAGDGGGVGGGGGKGGGSRDLARGVPADPQGGVAVPFVGNVFTGGDPFFMVLVPRVNWGGAGHDEPCPLGLLPPPGQGPHTRVTTVLAPGDLREFVFGWGGVFRDGETFGGPLNRPGGAGRRCQSPGGGDRFHRFLRTVSMGPRLLNTGRGTPPDGEVPSGRVVPRIFKDGVRPTHDRGKG